MTLKETIIEDQDAVFLDEDEFAYSMVWTPKGGVAQAAVSVFFNDFPMTGDPWGEKGVDQQSTHIIGKASDLSGIQEEDEIFVKSITFEAINSAYPIPNSNIWSVVELRYPHGQETRI